jgi:pimeloyl-ACP methyl ester carboxylesterase
MANDPVVVGRGPRHVHALHGWFGSARGWGWLPDLIDEASYTYAFVDYRGYGARKGETGDFTLAEIATDALAAADLLGWDRFAVFGHSMGGTAMQRVMLDAGGRVTAMVGLSPVPSTGVPFDDQSWQLFSGAAGNRDNRYAIIDLTTGNRLSSHWINSVVDFSLRESDADAFGAYLEAWAKTDFSAEVAGHDIPVKVIVGEHDPALSAEVMRQTFLAQYPRADLEVLPNAGHYAVFETPVALATSVGRFLDSV